MKRKIRYLIGLAIIIAALIYVILTSLQTSLEFYVTVSELMAHEGDFRNKVLKVAGAASGIIREDEGQKSLYRFHVEEGDKTILVSYRGLAPDTFREGSNVVVTGHLLEDGSFGATQILAKCASKYEAKMEKK